MQLQELKNTYDACCLSKKEYERLHEAREQLYERALKDSQFIKELRKIDHALDELGEDHEERLEKAKNALISAIHHLNPPSLTEYQTLSQQLALLGKQGEQARRIHEKLLPFQKALNTGSGAKNQRGLFFGRNEKVLLAEAIQKGAEAAKKISPFAEDQTMSRFLEKFICEAERPWNGKLYKEHFYELHQEFMILIEEIETKITQSSSDSLRIERELELWIEKNSG